MSGAIVDSNDNFEERHRRSPAGKLNVVAAPQLEEWGAWDCEHLVIDADSGTSEVSDRTLS